MRYAALASLVFMASPALAASLVPSNGVISSSGEYYLAADRTTTGTTNIEITASGVTLNLNGKTVRCNPANPASAVTFGVKMNTGNNRVYNGKVTGCFMGVKADGSSGNVIEGIDFSGNTYIGVNGGTVIRGNIFDDMAGYEGEPYAIGINAPGGNCLIFGNTFRNLHRQPVSDPEKIGEGVGALLNSGSTNCVVEANWFENDELGSERDIGVWVAVGGSASIHDNSFTNLGWAVANRGTTTITDNRFWMRDEEEDSVAIDGDGASATTTATGNVIIDFDDAFLGTVSASDNLILP